MGEGWGSGISRRELLKAAGLCAAGVGVGGLGVGAVPLALFGPTREGPAGADFTESYMERIVAALPSTGGVRPGNQGCGLERLG